jgi:16S rRNA (adenine1518-N6/adenine1519-N6)-dimethyltransferase
LTWPGPAAGEPFMTHLSLRPLKRFGQNFLADPNINRKIIRAVNAGAGDRILEIGPGRGALTWELAKTAAHVYAVEIDKKLCAWLAPQAADRRNVTLICADILKFDFHKDLLRHGVKKIRVVSNLPYYITTPVLEYLFERIDVIEDIFLTIQKEVAQRLVAGPGDPSYGSLSCFVDYYCQAQILFPVAPACFKPKPGVDSSFVRLKPRRDRQERLGLRSQDWFFRVVRTSFGQRRKTLRASLSSILDRSFLQGLGVDDMLNRRPETLSSQEFASLSNRIFEIFEESKISDDTDLKR